MSRKKKKRRCTSCDRALRKGSKNRRAWVISPHGELESGIVCSRCALRAMAFVVPPPTTIPPLCSQCKGAPASVCGSCHDRVCKAVASTMKLNVLETTAAHHEQGGN